ncbi:hypothetical protein [Sphingomonas immobilis]|uniref:UrcA family protein n=1 Tax=Sphingomonas immobilis TaxID=3063997 RepID=A0ABT9A0G8_9SPHN|nr:hypothetical protein [Sphingomonas sp. CA1-15]MDO7843326.1 hypothetical protein [Sphingomonas sp. CA1-15]
MILLPLLLAGQAAETPPDVVVMHDKLRKLRVSTQLDARGRVHACAITVSSGDRMIDERACLATRDCVAAGNRDGETLANCVDAKLVAFVRSGMSG